MYSDIYSLKFPWNLFKIFLLPLNSELLGISNFSKFIKMLRGGMKSV